MNSVLYLKHVSIGGVIQYQVNKLGVLEAVLHAHDVGVSDLGLETSLAVEVNPILRDAIAQIALKQKKETGHEALMGPWFKAS